MIKIYNGNFIILKMPFVIIDMISRIKVGYITRKSSVLVRYSKICYLILNILTKNGYIYGYEIKLDGILVFLRYVNGVPIIREIASVSKPGRIITVKNKDMLGKFNNSFLIISTKNGLVGRGFDEPDINRKGFGGILLFYII